MVRIYILFTEIIKLEKKKQQLLFIVKLWFQRQNAYFVHKPGDIAIDG